MDSMLYPINSISRRSVSLDGLWKFQFDNDANGLEKGWNFELDDPIEIPVPASFNDFFTDKDAREYCGDFWYEKDVFVPQEWQGNDIFIRFSAATHRGRVYVNGYLVGEHEGGFLPFNCNITNVIYYNQYNRVCV